MLPRDVLAKIASHANTRTQMRMRATSKAMYTNRLAATRPLRLGYAYGTGKLQKDYNELPGKLRTLEKTAMLLVVRKRWAPHPQWYRELRFLREFVEETLQDYKSSIKTNHPNVTVDTLGGFAFLGAFERELAGKFQKQAGTSGFVTYTAPREDLVTAALVAAKGALPGLAAQAQAAGSGSIRPLDLAKARRGRKQTAAHDWQYEMRLAPEERARSRASRLARRAARRLQR